MTGKPAGLIIGLREKSIQEIAYVEGEKENRIPLLVIGSSEKADT